MTEAALNRLRVVFRTVAHVVITVASICMVGATRISNRVGHSLVEGNEKRIK
jgi:hypothetical protein